MAMSGPSHYRQAEKLLRESRSISGDDLDPAQLLIATLLEAQVHATLALTAATAQWPAGTAEVSLSSMTDWEDWCQATRAKVMDS